MGFRGEYAPAHAATPIERPDSPALHRLLKGGLAVAGSWAAQNIESIATVAEYELYLHTDPVFRDFIYPPDITSLLTSQQPTRYDLDSILKTRIITFGDSLVVGRVDGGIDYPSAWHIARKMNQYVHKNNWIWQNEAWNGANTADVRKQIAKTTLKDSVTIDTDIIISVGSNDLLQEPNLLSQLDALRQNPTNISALRTFTHDFDAYLHIYRQNIQSILQDILLFAEEKDARVNRVLAYGSPNTENAKHLELPHGEILPMIGATKEFTARCSSLINLSMAKTVLEIGKHMPFDVRFIHNATLRTEDFSGMHPNEQGYIKMAENQMRQSTVSLPTYEGTSLYDLAA